ncbi:MAG: hypothetical protein LBC75_05595 [Fibromonadaceae bacterium]|jgi:hypothetical protein|nr:hypothetical protein [Fibromonadaceae bacterium]
MGLLFFIGLATASLMLGYTCAKPEKASFAGKENENRYTIEDVQKTQSSSNTADYVLHFENNSCE